MDAKHALLAERSLFYTPEGAGARERVEVPLEALQRVHTVDRGLGAAKGLGIGLLSGLGAAAVPLVLARRNGGCDCAGGSIILGGASVVLGSVLGLVVGGIIGHSYGVTLETPPPPPSAAR